MTILEKHRTEYELIDEALNELAKVTQKIKTVEAAAEEYRRAAEELSRSEMMNRKVIEQLEEQLVQERTKNDALTTDLERMNAEMTFRDAEREKLREDLQRETAERKEGGERLRKFLNQLQDLKHSAPGGNVQFMKEAV